MGSLFVYSHAQDSGKLTTRKITKGDVPDDSAYKNFRFTVGGGYSYGIGKLMKTGDKKLDDFSSGLRGGYDLDFSAQYFFHEYMGIGLDGNFVKRSNSESGVLNVPGLGSISGYKETNKLVYVGPSFVVRYENDKWGFYSGVGFGPLFYKAIGEISGREVKLDKTTFGANLSVAGEYRISPVMGVGLKAAVTAGSVKIEGMEDRISASSFMLSGFLSFRTR